MSHVYLKGNFISPNVRLSSWLMRRQHKEIVSHVPPQMHSIISLFFCGYKYSFHFISEKFWHHAVTWPIGRFGESAVNLHQLLRYHRKCQKSENGNCETGGEPRRRFIGVRMATCSVLIVLLMWHVLADHPGNRNAGERSGHWRSVLPRRQQAVQSEWSVKIGGLKGSPVILRS